MSGPVQRGYLTALGSTGIGAAVFDYHGRLDRKTFPAETESWPEIAVWLADRGAVEIAMSRFLAREFVVWLATQPFVLVDDGDVVPCSAEIVSWRDTVTAEVSTTWFPDYETLTTTHDSSGLAQIEEFVRRLPVGAKLKLIDADGTSAPLVEHLRRTGRTFETSSATDPWAVIVECYPDRYRAFARANGASQSTDLPNDRAGSRGLMSWIQGLGPVRGVMILDADRDSAILVEILREARVRHRVERATRGDLEGEPGEMFGGIRFQLVLRGLGWLVIRMQVGADDLEVVASSMTSAWRDTANGIRAAFDARAPVVMVWCEEPGAYQLVTSRLPDGLLDIHLQFLPDDLWGKPEEPFAGDRVGRWTVDAHHFARAFVSASQRLFRAVPHVDLMARWPDGAPLDELELLALRANM